MRHFSNSFNIAAIVFLLPTRHRINGAFEALLLSTLLLLKMELFVKGKASPEIWEVFSLVSVTAAPGAGLGFPCQACLATFPLLDQTQFSCLLEFCLFAL